MSDNYQYVNLQFLKEFSDNDMEFIKEYITDFLDAVPTDMTNLDEAFKTQDWDTAYRISHDLKTASKYLSIELIRTDIEALEAFAREKQASPEIAPKLENVQDICGKVIEELKSIVGSM